MSHSGNDLYLENCRESFLSSEHGFERATVLFEMHEQGFDEQADTLEEQWFDERIVWLEAVGVRENEVLEDEEGEYFMDIEELGNPGDDYQVNNVKRRMPVHLRPSYWLDKNNYKREKYPYEKSKERGLD